MKRIQLGLCLIDENGHVMTTKTVGTEWSVDLETDLKSASNSLVVDEIAAIMTENLTRNLKSEVVEGMLNEVKDKDWG